MNLEFINVVTIEHYTAVKCAATNILDSIDLVSVKFTNFILKVVVIFFCLENLTQDYIREFLNWCV